MKDKIKNIIEKHEVLHENGTYWDEKLLKEKINKMYEELFDLYEPSIIEIDFDGNLKVQMQTYDTNPEILKGVNGYGQPLDCKGVRINEV